MANGPYRLVRNPLNLGSWCSIGAMAFIMPASGAIFCMVLLSVFLLRLILGEEAFLTAQIGEPYRAYQRRVPRLIPRLRSQIAGTGAKPHWGRAVFSEFNPIGVLVVLCTLSWRFDNWLMVRAMLVSFGVSMVVRALVPSTPRQVGSPA